MNLIISPKIKIKDKKYYCKNCNKLIHWQSGRYGSSLCYLCARPRKEKHHLWNGERHEIHRCKYCDNIIHYVTFRKGKGRCLSCAQKQTKGKNHPLHGVYGKDAVGYKNGRTSLYSSIRRLFEYRQWRSDVFTKDEFTCQDCGETTKRLNAHHIISFYDIVERYEIVTSQQAIDCAELWNINNGVTLCKECHKAYHKKAKKQDEWLGN